MKTKIKIRRFTPAAANELQIDADRFPRRLTELLGVFEHNLWLNSVESITFSRSKSKEHWHVRIVLNEKLPPMDRIALQAIFGSDPMRELMNWMRVRNNAPHPILFLED
jgi:hypothetical protein